MSEVTETYSLGVPVEVGKIDHELKKLAARFDAAVRAFVGNALGIKKSFVQSKQPLPQIRQPAAR